jgi:hypothetical protein
MARLDLAQAFGTRRECASWSRRPRARRRLQRAKIAPAFVELVRVAPEKPENATVRAMPGVEEDLPGALHDGVGALQRGAVGQLIAVIVYAWSDRMNPVGTVLNIVPVSSNRPA